MRACHRTGAGVAGIDADEVDSVVLLLILLQGLIPQSADLTSWYIYISVSHFDLTCCLGLIQQGLCRYVCSI